MFWFVVGIVVVARKRRGKKYFSTKKQNIISGADYSK